MIYEEYTEFCKKDCRKLKIDMLHIKKRLEELSNSNLITIKQDEKYSDVYELKLPDDQIAKLFDRMYKNGDKINQNMFLHLKSYS